MHPGVWLTSQMGNETGPRIVEVVHFADWSGYSGARKLDSGVVEMAFLLQHHAPYSCFETQRKDFG